MFMFNGSFLLLLVVLLSGLSFPSTAVAHEIGRLVGERLEYDSSFLWFDPLAEGQMTLESGPREQTWLIVMQARTLRKRPSVTISIMSLADCVIGV
jgi:hypothetical protein